MFCPKCGTKNPDNGKFCRKCGTDLETVSDAITGKLSISNKYNEKNGKKEKVSWEGAISKLFSGLAFLIIAIILGYTGAAGGRAWWFWMLIPAFAMIGSGIAQVIQIKHNESRNITISSNNDVNEFSSNQPGSLPPKQTEFVSNIPDSTYKTGDLVPPSIVENTTRHLEMDKEGETMTLPKVEK